MGQQITIKSLLKGYRIEDIEKHLVFHLLSVRNLDYSANLYLSKYFSDFTENKELSDRMAELNHINLTDITSDMELLIPQEDKKTNGAFFIHPYIVGFIVRHVYPQVNEKITDLR